MFTKIPATLRRLSLTPAAGNPPHPSLTPAAGNPLGSSPPPGEMQSSRGPRQCPSCGAGPRPGQGPPSLPQSGNAQRPGMTFFQMTYIINTTYTKFEEQGWFLLLDSHLLPAGQGEALGLMDVGVHSPSRLFSGRSGLLLPYGRGRSP